jgi:hypothetical protein
MGLAPNIQRKKKFMLKDCTCCGGSFGVEGFAPTTSIFYPDGVIPVCNDCIDKMIDEHGADWQFIDKLCQMADIPFIPKEWETIAEMNTSGVFYKYAQVFLRSEYDGITWGDYFELYRTLRDAGKLEDELPGISDDKRARLKKTWGATYDDEALEYLDSLYQGLLSTQNINGKLQMDQAQKICKMSYEIDRRIEEGADFDKLLSSYDKLVKAAEFTPKNVKNINDFDTFGEAVKWMEKNGWRNRFYDNVTRDVVDETMKNYQNFAQRLYTNESSIGDEVTRRLEALKTTAELENDSYYGTNKEYDLDQFERDGFEVTFAGEEEEFNIDLDGDEE